MCYLSDAFVDETFGQRRSFSGKAEPSWCIMTIPNGFPEGYQPPNWCIRAICKREPIPVDDMAKIDFNEDAVKLMTSDLPAEILQEWDFSSSSSSSRRSNSLSSAASSALAMVRWSLSGVSSRASSTRDTTPASSRAASICGSERPSLEVAPLEASSSPAPAASAQASSQCGAGTLPAPMDAPSSIPVPVHTSSSATQSSRSSLPTPSPWAAWRRRAHKALQAVGAAVESSLAASLAELRDASSAGETIHALIKLDLCYAS